MNLDLTSIPGLRYAALINPAGQIMDNEGHIDGDSTIAAILTQAAMSAAIDLGQRSALGECQDIALAYAGGGMLASLTADGHILLFQHTHEASLDRLRQAARKILADLDEPEAPPPAQPRTRGLMDALNAAQP